MTCRSVVPIPSSIAEVTPAWLTTVLSEQGEGEVVAARATRVGEGVGIMGELHRVELEWSHPGAGPSSVVVKQPSRHQANRELARDMRLYLSEVRFYQELAARTTARLPRCYHAELGPDEISFVLVLEDLSHLPALDQLSGLTPSQASAAVRTLADLHASWWGKAIDPELDWIPSLVHERIRRMAELWPAVWHETLVRSGDRLSAEARAVGERMCESYFELMSALVQGPWTLLHMDYRPDNLFIDGEEAVIVDWQSLGRGGAAYDLAHILSSGLTVPQRRAQQADLIAQYHSRLSAGGIDYPLDQLRVDYLRGLLVTTATPVLVTGTMELGNERGAELIGDWLTRSFTACLDNDALSVLTG